MNYKHICDALRCYCNDGLENESRQLRIEYASLYLRHANIIAGLTDAENNAHRVEQLKKIEAMPLGEDSISLSVHLTQHVAETFRMEVREAKRVRAIMLECADKLLRTLGETGG